MNRNLLILGAGEYGLVAKETAEAMDCFDEIAFLDDTGEYSIGKFSEYERFVAGYSSAFVATGNAALRLSWIQKLTEVCYQMAVLVSPRACISPSAQIQKGSIVEAGAVINTGSVLGIGVVVSAGAIVNHNCFIGDVCHLDCGCVVKANTIMPLGTVVKCGQIVGAENFLDGFRKCPKDYCF